MPTNVHELIRREQPVRTLRSATPDQATPATEMAAVCDLHADKTPFSAGRDRAALLAQLTEAGAGSDDIKRVREEVAAIERALSPEAFHE